MNHHKKTRKFGRVKKVRTALMKSLALSLILKEKIKTTEPKAKELRPFVEKLITVGKNKTLASQKNIISKIGEKGAKKIVDDLSVKYKDRNGGYTRITKLQQRISDGSFMAIIELI